MPEDPSSVENDDTQGKQGPSTIYDELKALAQRNDNNSEDTTGPAQTTGPGTPPGPATNQETSASLMRLGIEDVPGDELVGILVKASTTSSKDGLQLALRNLRIRRQAGNIPYRINDTYTYTLDLALVKLVQSEHFDLAKELISSSPQDLPQLERVLERMELEPKTKSDINTNLKKLCQQKQDELRQELEDKAVSRDMADIVARSTDPDSFAGIPTEFWHRLVTDSSIATANFLNIIQSALKNDSEHTYVNDLKASVNDLAVDAFLRRIEEPELVSTRLRDQITEQLISNPKGFGDLIAALSTDPKLHRLVTDPSIATADFLNIIQSAMLGDQELIIKAGSGFIAENYAQASKLMDPSQIDYYTARVSIFVKTIDSIATSPVLLAAYRSFLERAGSISPESEQRAASLFETLRYLGEEDIGDMTNLDEIEGGLVASFLTKLSDGQVNVSPEQQRALIEGFGTLTPILIYALKYIGQDEYKEALSGLVESVASGTYETWKRGDGSVEALRELVEAGYLPENLTPEQYVEWCTDRRADTREQMVSSAEDTAFAIRDVVANGSIDIAMLAPGYSVKLEDLQVVIADRNGLGQLLAGLNKAAKGQTEGILSANLLNELESSLGEAGITSGVADVLKMLKDGASIAEAKRAAEIKRTQLEQLRLLIRVANISKEEVASGALLTEPDKNGVRKIQQQLDDVISMLTKALPPAIAFIPQSVKQILTDHLTQNDKIELFEVEDTIDPKVTLEIGETPQRTCQHYESGMFNEGLIGYYDPEVKIIIVRNENGGIIGRSIMRLMQDENGDAVLFIETIYVSVSSPTVRTMIEEHASKKAAEMGIELISNLLEFGSRLSDKPRIMIVRKLKMPAVYSDNGGGLKTGSMKMVS